MRNEEMAIWANDSEDFSPSATLVRFDQPIPLLRAPVPADSSDDPSIGPFVLAFRDAESWRSAFRDTESKITEQCEAGARIGCSISASNKCKPLWWKSLFGATAADFAERERCEEREMSSCVAASKEPCIQFAKEKCLPPFRDARIALIGQKGIPQLDSQTGKNISDAEVAETGSVSLRQACFFDSARCDSEVTNYRGSELLKVASIGINME